eukprot:TRINITY_DN8180_c0_g1_i2.p1 TRINITY_DN8180_c0_g1~~TRINITY_DN8180_c0_g1_i2.p1  ORF type:complete len:1262 (+),score=290.72 TRINITY_DN8180_c0_g1_i2:54-3839(+)
MDLLSEQPITSFGERISKDLGLHHLFNYSDRTTNCINVENIGIQGEERKAALIINEMPLASSVMEDLSNRGKEIVVTMISKSLPNEQGPKIWQRSYTLKRSRSFVSLQQYVQELRDPIRFSLDASDDDRQNEMPSFEPRGITKQWIYTASHIFEGNANLKILSDIIEVEDAFYICQERIPMTLESLLRFSKQKLISSTNGDSPVPTTLWVLYQLLSALDYAHSHGITHGNLNPADILLSSNLWLTLTGFHLPATPMYLQMDEKPDRTLQNLMEGWRNGKISNFDYLMALNLLSGRRTGDPNFHPFMPWVIDFTEQQGKWRDLTKSKYRLTKGDEQLDVTYLSTDRSHHITEPLSELTYYHYQARRTPIPLLRKYVRSTFQPNEYPSTIERLYEWTPDECIPEFFTDPLIFKSIHEDMPDLAVPSWAESPRDFIKIHRDLLESDQVSLGIHHWIDLTFGYKLSSQEAVRAKNVALIDSVHLRNHGFVQIFKHPHPPRLNCRPFADIILDGIADTESAFEFLANLETLLPVHRPPVFKLNETPPFQDEPFLELAAADMYSFGCLMAEMYLAHPLFNPNTIRQYIYKRTLPRLDELPHAVRALILSLIRQRHWKRPSAQSLLTHDIFPSYFTELYTWLSAYHSITDWKQRLNLTIDNLSTLLALPEEGFEIAIPFFLQFFSEPTEIGVKVKAVNLIDPLGAKLGVANSRKYLLQPLIRLYQIQTFGDLSAVLFDDKVIKSIVNRLGLAPFIDYILPYTIDSLRNTDNQIAYLSSLLMSNIPDVLGEVLTVKYVLHPLLLQLSKTHPEYIVEVLLILAKKLGEKVILEHYLGQLLQLLQKHSSKATKGGEEVLISVLQVIKGLLDEISPSAILQQLILDSNVLFVLLLNPSPHSSLIKILIQTFIYISYRIGSIDTCAHILPYIKQFLHNYSDFFELLEDGTVVPTREQGSHEALRSVYSLEIGAMLYDQLCSLVSNRLLRNEIPKHWKLLEAIVKTQPKSFQIPLSRSSTPPGSSSMPASGSFSSSSSLSSFGSLSSFASLGSPPALGSGKHADDWLTAISKSEGESNRSWNLEGKVLNIFSGNQGGIRCMDALSNESLFVTGSKDCTVKIWNIHHPQAKLSYNEHTSGVTGVHFIFNGTSVASCGGSVHIWDTERKVRTFLLSSDVSFTSMLPTKEDRIIVVANLENTLSFLDVSMGKPVYEWYLPGAALYGSCKCIATANNGNWMAIGTNTGDIVTFDKRTGYILEMWKAHEGPITQVCCSS